MVKYPLTCREIIYSGHAVRRMFERDLRPGEVRAVIEGGEIIASYPDDQPYASYLLLRWSHDRPLHVVLAVDIENRRCYVITAYIPDLTLWQPDFKTRR
jgi:hypothetical protein